jgi:imidazolonepropionase-like amidohydrolase
MLGAVSERMQLLRITHRRRLIRVPACRYVLQLDRAEMKAVVIMASEKTLPVAIAVSQTTAAAAAMRVRKPSPAHGFDLGHTPLAAYGRWRHRRAR